MKTQKLHKFLQNHFWCQICSYLLLVILFLPSEDSVDVFMATISPSTWLGLSIKFIILCFRKNGFKHLSHINYLNFFKFDRERYINNVEWATKSFSRLDNCKGKLTLLLNKNLFQAENIGILNSLLLLKYVFVRYYWSLLCSSSITLMVASILVERSR